MPALIKKYPIWLVVILYALLVLAFTWPLIFHLSDRLAGNNIDNWIFYWNNWWLKQALQQRVAWFYTPYLYFPQGTSLVAHSNSFLNSLLAWLLTPFTGPVAAFNLVFLGGLWVGAVGMYALVHEITQHKPAAFLAGFVFAFAPYHLTQALSHAHLGSIHWWPFYVLYLRRLWGSERSQWQNSVAGGLFFALTIWSGLQLGVLLGLFTALFLLWHIRQTSRQRVVQLLLLGVVTGALSAPILWPVVVNWRTLAGGTANFDEGESQQTDLLAYVAPPTYHPFWGEPMVAIYKRFEANQASMAYVGFAVLLLIIAAGVGKVPENGFWWATTAVALLFSAGSSLRFNGNVYALPLPYGAIDTIFPLSAIRSPDRFNLVLVLAVAVLVGLGSAFLWQKRAWAVVLLAGVTAVEYLALPLPMWQLPLSSPVLAQIAQEHEPTAVLDYPMGYTIAKLWLYYQTLHGHPLVEGHVSRYTADTYATITQQPILAALYQSSPLPGNLPPIPPTPLPLPHLGPALRDLQAQGVAWVLLHQPYTSEAERAYFEAVLPLLPVSVDEALAVYDLRRPRPVVYGEPLRLGQGVMGLETAVSLNGDGLAVKLLAQATNGIQPLSCVVQIEDHSTPLLFFAGSGWQAGDYDWQAALLPLPMLPVGNHPVQVICGAQAVLLADLVVATNGRFLQQDSLNARYGPAITLLGTRQWTANTHFHVALNWQTAVPLTADYKVYVHLLNENGEIVRQWDAMPCNWACPTSTWVSQQPVADEAVLELWGLPDGTYHLAVGLYDEAGRLPVTMADGTAVADNYLRLSQTLTIRNQP